MIYYSSCSIPNSYVNINKYIVRTISNCHRIENKNSETIGTYYNLRSILAQM